MESVIRPRYGSVHSCRANLLLLITLLACGDSIAEAQTGRSPALYYDRANAHYAKGNMKAAVEDYTAAIAFDPEFAEAYNRRAQARSALGDLEGALGDLKKAIEIDPQFVEARGNLGNLRLTMGDYDAALEDLEQSLRA